MIAYNGVVRGETTVIDAFVMISIPAPLRFLWRPQLEDPADAAREFGIRVARPGDARREIRRHEKK
jgi:hypothetical protein